MSNNIFTKNKLNEIFNNSNSESSIILQNSINIVDTHKFSNMLQSSRSATSDFNSSDMPQKGGNYSATSSDMPQKGGNFSATSSDMPQKGGNFSATSSDMSQNNNNSNHMFIPQKGGSFDDKFTSSVVLQKRNFFDDNLTSSVVPQKGGFFNNNLTSSVVPQKGGSFNNNNDVNQLISMLTPESNDKNNFTTNSTNTEDLENRLRNML
jgi:hypothetical protein